jgi:hypothetical protein
MNLVPVTTALTVAVALAVAFQVGYLVRVGLAAGVIRTPFPGSARR